MYLELIIIWPEKFPYPKQGRPGGGHCAGQALSPEQVSVRRRRPTGGGRWEDGDRAHAVARHGREVRARGQDPAEASQG